METNAYTFYWNGSRTTADYASRLCYIMEYNHDGVLYDDWFLPSKEELSFMYEGLYMKRKGAFSYGAYWSSSESDADEAWLQYIDNGRQYNGNRSDGGYVRPARAF